MCKTYERKDTYFLKKSVAYPEFFWAYRYIYLLRA